MVPVSEVAVSKVSSASVEESSAGGACQSGSKILIGIEIGHEASSGPVEETGTDSYSESGVPC